MKLIFKPRPPCDCATKATEFHQTSGEVWPVGTIVECDCGRKVVLRLEHDGLFWVRQLQLRANV